MEGMEDGVARPRQVRYQAALRPDCIHSTSLPELEAACEHWVLIQRTCGGQPDRRSSSVLRQWFRLRFPSARLCATSTSNRPSALPPYARFSSPAAGAAPDHLRTKSYVRWSCPHTARSSGWWGRKAKPAAFCFRPLELWQSCDVQLPPQPWRLPRGSVAP